MPHKWKFILTNWINCYTTECSQKEQSVTTKSLLTIISHLRKNINLDESKTSTLEAQTIEEFIVEKYPEFKFENGTTEASSEEELFMAASLLLYFVCVNSKNVDIKTAMCSQLSTDDQETILKFSQYLMHCSKITFVDVLNAITEACGPDVAGGERTAPMSVAETPPALRSLHSEVRRLRAALDAERFDRTYLQDELAATVARLEAVQKEKEHYKLEIVNLKGKISLCCGAETEARGGDAAAENAAKLAKQIEELELKLLNVKEQLDDVIYERNTYKAKVQELKQERDKWVATSQEEATRAEQLLEQLETERRQAMSLRELVTELRQHRSRSGLDSSQVECDDLDASVHSLQNASVCSEACANVIEVQLSEERAKIVGLKQLIQTLQDQLNDLNQKAEHEKQSLQTIIAEKDDDIFNLKHRINEEIEEKSKLQSQFNDECIRLNNEINELEQKLRDVSETSRHAVEQKMEEIKSVQEEKLSLLHSLSNETTKLENVMKELETEKTSKHKLKENYENQIIKLKEKILNRNNELVELQNNISQNSEMIEQLHLELRSEREIKEKLANKYHQDIAHLTHERKAVEINLSKTVDEAKELQKRLLQNVAVFEELNKEIDDLKLANTKTLHDLEEKNATINTLKMQLQDEIHYKTHLQNELIQLQQTKTDLTSELNTVISELNQLKTDFAEKDKTIYSLDLHLIEAKQAKDNLMEEFHCKSQEVDKLIQDLDSKERELACINRNFEHERKEFKEQLRKKDDDISDVIEKLEAEISDKNVIKTKMISLESKVDSLSKDLHNKCEEILMLKTEYDKYVEVAEKNSKFIESLEHRLESENQRYSELQKTFDMQTSTLMAKLIETEKSIKEHNSQYKNAMEKKELQLQTWKLEVEKMQKIVDNDTELTKKMENEKEALGLKLGEEIVFREKLEKEYLNQCIALNNITSQLNSEIASKNQEIITMNQQLRTLEVTIEEKCKDIEALSENLNQEKVRYEKLFSQKNCDIDVLQKKIDEYIEIESSLKNEINCKISAVGNLQKENEHLRVSVEHLKSSEAELQEKRAEKEDLILKLKYLIEEQKQSIETIKSKNADLKLKIENISKEKSDLESNTSEYIQELLDQVSLMEGKLAESQAICVTLKGQLTEEKSVREVLENEKSQMIIEKETLARELEQEQIRIDTLNEETNNLLHETTMLTQTLVEERNLHQIIQQELQILKADKEDLTRKLNTEIQIKDSLISDKEYISQVLNEEIELKNSLFERLNNEIKEKERIVNENVSLTQQLQNEIKSRVSLLEEKEQIAHLLNKEIEEKNALLKQNGNLNEKLVLTHAMAQENHLSVQKLQEALSHKEQQLDEIRALKDIIIQEKESLTHQLEEEIDSKKKMLQDKQSILQELGEEKTAKILALQEKEAIWGAKERLENDFKVKDEFINTIVKEKNDLLAEYNGLYSQFKAELAAKDILNEENNKLTELLAEEKRVNKSLNHNISDFKAVQEAIISDKELLTVEKEVLMKSLQKEKAVRDELESEKKLVAEELHVLQQRLDIEVSEKTLEVETVIGELQHLKADIKKHEDTCAQVASLINSNLDRLLENLKKVEVTKELLDSFTNINRKKFSTTEWCRMMINVVDNLTTEMMCRKNVEVALREENTSLKGIEEMVEEKEEIVKELRMIVANLEETVHKYKADISVKAQARKEDDETLSKEIKTLQEDNKSLVIQLNDVKFQLETKVHSLKEKLTDNENLTEKLKESYELQIDNMNVVVTKLTECIKQKTAEIDSLKDDKERMQKVVDDTLKVIKTLEKEVVLHKEDREKLVTNFESERLVLKNMVSVTESVMEDQKAEFNKIVSELKKDLEFLQEENKTMQKQIDIERMASDTAIREKDAAIDLMFKQLSELKAEVEKIEVNMKIEKNGLQQEMLSLRHQLNGKLKQLEEFQAEILRLKQELHAKETLIESLEAQNKELNLAVKKFRDDVRALQDKEVELEAMTDSLTIELFSELDQLAKAVNEDVTQNYKLKLKDTLQAKIESKFDIIERIKSLNSVVILLFKENVYLEKQRRENSLSLEQLQADFQTLSKENEHLSDKIEENERALCSMQKQSEETNTMFDKAAYEKLNLENKCSLLQEYQIKAEKELCERDREINSLKENAITNNEGELERLTNNLKDYEKVLKEKSELINKIEQDKDMILRELERERNLRERIQKELDCKAATYGELRDKLELIKTETGVLRKENDNMIKSVGQRESLGVAALDRLSQKAWSHGEEHREHLQVSTPTSDLTHSSLDSIRTISDLEKIIHDKNRTITTLQSDITYLKTLMAESENKLLDVTNELELTKENCHQLSAQLKKIVHQKNDEIADLKKQVNKMTMTENRASQIIKVSSKYQAIILKRIAEIKSNTVLKELTNFGNTSNENDLRRSLTAGGITMEDLENFLETTDRHLKRCAEKQITLQKERDRLTEVNKINESEILNLKKFLTELSLSFKTFNSVKEVYTQKLSKVVSVQRTVRREILDLDGTLNDATMCKLERGYAAIMQDLAECAMNLERWVERSISRTISPEKIKQAFSCDSERSSLATTTFQNASLEVQLEELENSFHKLMEEIGRAQRGEGTRDTQALTVMEVRAEYEDKLNRMKAKMKQLYQEQIAVFKEKQREEIASLERELLKTREKFAKSSKDYEEHIKSLTTELWTVGEKFLMKKDEAEWLRKQRSGSLMSLQHVHSGGLQAHQGEPTRHSDTHSLRSLPVTVQNEKRGGRGLQMSDEEGEVFDNRWLKELATTPRRETMPPGQRLSELKWRNSLCPPHLKSSYPAETQFASTFDEEDLKCTANGGKPQRKEVGITAYKKPGPPTPSKNAGRLSATDSELRESLRPEPEAHASRKTSTPSRLRALFRSHRNDTTEGTPRSRRLSSIFRKK